MQMFTFDIFIEDGAPGKPGKHVTNAVYSLHGPRPQLFIPETRNLQAMPGSSCFLTTFSCETSFEETSYKQNL